MKHDETLASYMGIMMDYDKPFLFSDPYETSSISWKVSVSSFKLSIQKPGHEMKHERRSQDCKRKNRKHGCMVVTCWVEDHTVLHFPTSPATCN